MGSRRGEMKFVTIAEQSRRINPNLVSSLLVSLIHKGGRGVTEATIRRLDGNGGGKRKKGREGVEDKECVQIRTRRIDSQETRMFRRQDRDRQKYFIPVSIKEYRTYDTQVIQQIQEKMGFSRQRVLHFWQYFCRSRISLPMCVRGQIPGAWVRKEGSFNIIGVPIVWPSLFHKNLRCAKTLHKGHAKHAWCTHPRTFATPRWILDISPQYRPEIKGELSTRKLPHAGRPLSKIGGKTWKFDKDKKGYRLFPSGKNCVQHAKPECKTKNVL